MPSAPQRTVDIHAHVILPDCMPLVEGLMAPEMEPFSYFGGDETNEYQVGHVREIMPKATDPATRIADMDAMGIDVQAISVAPAGFFYWADPELALELARMQNENL
ncbi:MAG: amidohydrolase, partial [Marmoricola sp.]|nr:amidohydrolase [Marmoricola sp.]